MGLTTKWLKGKESYSRALAIEAAGKARARGRKTRAIAELQRVLDVDPGDYVVHGKIAPLLAMKKRYNEAWTSFKTAAEGLRSAGFVEKALGVYAQAARYMPVEPEVWERIADIHLERGRRADFRARRRRPDCVRLLTRAFAIEPWDYEVTFELARSLKKTGDRSRALGLLEGLSYRVGGNRLRRVRGSIFLMNPAFTTAWRWLWAAHPRA